MFKIMYMVDNCPGRHEGCTKYETLAEAERKADYANNNFKRALHWVEREKP